MLLNYFKISLRNIIRNRLYSFLNVVGLAIGLACCIFILLYIQYELSFDRFHKNLNNIYRVNSHAYLQDREHHVANTTFSFGPIIKDEYPEVLDYVRFTPYREQKIIRYQDRIYHEEKFTYADNSLFSVFSFPLLKGNPKDALIEPNSLVLTEEMADKYFGDKEPLGQELLLNNETLFKVTGVLKSIPKTSHIRPDFIGSFSTLDLKPSGNVVMDMLSDISYITYFFMQKGTDPEDFEKKMAVFFAKNLDKTLKALGATLGIEIQPMKDIYLHSKINGQLESTSDIAYVYLFSGIGLFILLLACLNFMNLATAHSSERAKEVGLRKVVGAQRSQLIRQFLSESMVLSMISVLLSLIIVEITLPFFRSISAKDLSLDYLDYPMLCISLVCLFLFVSLLSGSYPAFFLSAFRPIEVLRGGRKGGTKSSLLRIVLVSFQFTVSIILIISTFTVQKQLSYIRGKKLGYNKQHILTLRLRNPDTQKQYKAIKDELIKHPAILNASASENLPLGSSGISIHHAADKPEDDTIALVVHVVDENFLDTFEVELVKGRNFSSQFPSDPDEAVIINETAMRELGWQDDTLNKEIELFESESKRKKFKVIGVVKDFHFRSLHSKIEPLIIYNADPISGQSFSLISLRLKPENIQETMAFIESKWKEFNSSYPFEYFFLDSWFDSLYRAEERLGQLFGYFTILAIVIGCLGLFGLTSFTIEQRTKEIGIRKVLGASVSSIIILLIKGFTKWVLLAVIIAWPIGYFITRTWLQSFYYRITLNWDTFFLAALVALMISIFTIGYHAIKTANTNPVRSLKYE